MTSTPTRDTGRPMTAPLAVPKVAPQRRWRPALVWLAVAMIAAGGLIAWRVLVAVGSSGQYLAVSRQVESGAVLTRDDLTTVRISRDPQLHPIAASKVNEVVGKHAAVALVPGTLLTSGQLTDQAVPGPGQQLVGVSLPQSRTPTQRVKPGAQVLLIITADDRAVVADKDQQPTAAPLSIPARVVDVGPGAKDGDVLLNVVLAERDGPLVASRAAAGRIVVVLTSGS